MIVLYKFKEEIKPNEPSLRIGSRIPENSINLAFVNGPPLESKNTVELFDYSKDLAESEIPLDVYQTRLYASTNRILRGSAGNTTIPVENVLVTSLHKTEGTETIPLWYTYGLRYYHYEQNPPLVTNDAGTWYIGQNIKIVKNGSIVKEGYLIELVGVGIENVYKVKIYSSFTSSKSDLYYVQYSKCNKTGGDRRYSFEELYNSAPFYVSKSRDVDSVVSASEGEKIFALEKLLSEDGFQIYAPEDVDLITSRIPITFRWRVRGETAFSGNCYSSWQTETLYRRDALYSEEFRNHLGQLIYFDDGSVARKLLCSNINSRVSASFTNPIIERELWDEGASTWTPDSSQILKFELEDNKKLFAYTLANTGTKIDLPGKICQSYPVHAFNVTIEGLTDPPQDDPAVETNVAKRSTGATATTDCSFTSFPKHTSPGYAVDGYDFSSLFFYGNTLAFPVFPTGVFTKWYARSLEQSGPPTNNVTTTVNFSGVKNINKVQIVMGEKGKIAKLELLLNGGGTHVLWASAGSVPSPSAATNTMRGYTWAGDPVGNCIGLRLTVTPSKWLTRDYGWLAELFGYRDLYQSGFDIYNITAIDYYDPAPLYWRKIKAIPLFVSENAPQRKSLVSLLKDNGLFPPVEIPTETVKYRISLGDRTDPNNIKDYNPKVSLDIKSLFGFGPVYGTEWDGTFNLGYSSVLMASLVPRVEDSVIVFSRMFSVKASGSSGIYMLPFENMSPDEMWFPKIKNGRFLKENIAEKLKTEYSIPEFGVQPFYPDIPYMYSEKEEAEYVDGYNIRVSNTPLHVVYDIDGNITNLNVYLEVGGIKTPIKVVSLNRYTGEIRIDRRVSFRDKIYCDYYYEQEYYIYKGYDDASLGKFFYLDLNPLPGHVSTYPLDGTGTEQPTWELLQDKAVYFYLLPTFTYSTDLSKEAPAPTNTSAVRHIIVSRDTPRESLSLPPGAMVIGQVHLNNPLTPKVIDVTDCRKRGGGFKDNLSKEFLQKLHPEAQSVWDNMGTLDGLPYPSNGVIEVTVPKSLLRENGGKLTDKEIRDIISKHVAYGVYVFVQYS